ncbi:MAG TPA: hypothetical protein VH437_12205 [Terriglobales bacterium]
MTRCEWGNWNLVKARDAFALDRKIRGAGWNFSFMAAEVKAMFFGAPGAKNIQNFASDLRESKTATLHALEVTGIITKRFLGLSYTFVSAHSRHFQESC